MGLLELIGILGYNTMSDLKWNEPVPTMLSA